MSFNTPTTGRLQNSSGNAVQHITFEGQRTDNPSMKKIFRVPYAESGEYVTKLIKNKFFTNAEHDLIAQDILKVKILYIDPFGYELDLNNDAEVRQMMKNFLLTKYDCLRRIIPVNGTYNRAEVKHCVIVEVGAETTSTERETASRKTEKSKRTQLENCPEDRVAFLCESGKRMTAGQRDSGAQWMLKETFTKRADIYKTKLELPMYGKFWKFNVPKVGKKTARGNFHCKRCRTTVRYHCGFYKFGPPHSKCLQTDSLLKHRVGCKAP